MARTPRHAGHHDMEVQLSKVFKLITALSSCILIHSQPFYSASFGELKKILYDNHARLQSRTSSNLADASTRGKKVPINYYRHQLCDIIFEGYDFLWRHVTRGVMNRPKSVTSFMDGPWVHGVLHSLSQHYGTRCRYNYKLRTSHWNRLTRNWKPIYLPKRMTTVNQWSSWNISKSLLSTCF